MKFAAQFDKICKVTKISQSVMLVFLVVLIVLCIFGLMGDNNYSCDNGLYLNVNEGAKDGFTKLTTALVSCQNKFSKTDPDHLTKFTDCLKNKVDYVHCVDSWQNIVLIIIISLAGLVFLVNLGCMFLPKSFSPQTAV